MGFALMESIFKCNHCYRVTGPARFGEENVPDGTWCLCCGRRIDEEMGRGMGTEKLPETTNGA